MAPVELGAEHLIVNEAPVSGWAVKNSAAETVAPDLATHELRLAGLARDVVRLVQDARDRGPLEVTGSHRTVVAGRFTGAGGSNPPHVARSRWKCSPLKPGRGAPDASEPAHEVVDDDLGLHVWLRRAT
jgi:isoleucyl-tRNA synthetase